MEDGGGGDGGQRRASWFDRRQSNKRNFSTMSASHRDDSPDSLFLPAHHDPHHDNEHSSRRRRIHTNPERQSERRLHYPGDGLDFRRPVMSANMRESSVNNDSVNVAAAAPAVPQVIDLTDENEGESEGTMAGRNDMEVAGRSAPAASDAHAHATGGQRLPRFGREVIDVEDNEAYQNHEHRFGGFSDDDVFGDLPGENYLALPPRRSASGRVQYSTLRRPTRPPSPPQEMDDGEIEYIGSRSFASAQERFPTPGPAGWLNNNIPRSVTPYPTGANAPIDLTNEADDDVLFVDARQRPRMNLDRPDGNAGNLTHAGEQGGFGIGRLAGILREGGAALTGRLARRVEDYDRAQEQQRPFANLDDEQLRTRRLQLEEERQRDQTRRRIDDLLPFMRTPGRPGRHHARVRRVHMDADGNIPGYQRVGWFPRGPAAVAQNGFPNLGDIGGMMDYGMAAFDMGYGGGGNRPPTPKYSPPPEPATGFTRNPGEDDVVVCPNCGDELAVGDEEAKQEIWVNKACGHAYCGDCTNHRQRSKSKKGKGRAVDAENLPEPFKHCVVEGCAKSTKGTNMVRVYFGS